MSRTPAHAGASGPGATPGGARPGGARPGTPASAKSAAAAATPFTRRNLIAGGSALAAVALLVALWIWKPWAPSPPRLNEDPALIARFAASSHMDDLPFSQQRQYMELLDDKDDRVVEAYEQGMLNDQEYRRALQLEWYGEHLKKMDKYHSKPPSQRAAYLDSQVEKKRKKKSKSKSETESDSKSALKPEEIERDDSTEDQDIKRWPADVRQKWNEYRTAWSNRKQYWKDLNDQKKEAAKAAEAAATPAGPGSQ
jgi:hypothetical protein